jgi:hypothetical protein
MPCGHFTSANPTTLGVLSLALSWHDVAGIHRTIVIILYKVFCCVCCPCAFVLKCSYFNIMTSLSMLSSWYLLVSCLACHSYPSRPCWERWVTIVVSSPWDGLWLLLLTVGSSLSLLFLLLLRLTNLFDVFRHNDVAWQIAWIILLTWTTLNFYDLTMFTTSSRLRRNVLDYADDNYIW